MTDASAMIAEWLTANPGSSGAQISKATGISTQRLYPCLAELEARGAVEAQWEVPEPRADGQPRRRLYWVNPNRVKTSSS